MIVAPPISLHTLVGRGSATVAQAFESRVGATPAAPFVREGERRWSFEQAWDEAARFAGFLASQGVTGRIGIYLSKRSESLWAWFGAVLAGVVPVSLSRSHRSAILADLIARSEISLLVTEAGALDELRGLATPLPPLLVCDRAWDPDLDAHSWCDVQRAVPSVNPARDPADPASIIFTSGTTGRSKAVLIPHNMLCRGAGRLADALGVTESDVFHDWMPNYDVSGQLHATMTSLIAGASLAMVPTFSTSRFWDEARAFDCTLFLGFANILSFLLAAPERDDDRQHALRAGLVAALNPVEKARFESRFGVPVFDSYGMSEAEPLTLPAIGAATPERSCGPINPDFEVRIVGDNDEPLPVGDVGRIVFRPRTPEVMMLGYGGDADATVATMRNLWFHTQDNGRLDERGFLYFSGRLKNSIRSRGENISIEELEAVVKGLETVADCAAVGVPNGQGDEDVKIVVVPSASERDPRRVADYCRANLARFMLPRYIEFRDTLPYSEIGKVDRAKLVANDRSTWDRLSAEAH